MNDDLVMLFYHLFESGAIECPIIHAVCASCTSLLFPNKMHHFSNATFDKQIELRIQDVNASYFILLLGINFTVALDVHDVALG